MLRVRGFTLVETTLMLAVLGIIVVSIIKVSNAVAQKTQLSSQLSVAAEIAQSRIEMIVNRKFTASYASVADVCPDATSICTLPSGYSVSQAAITNWQNQSDYKQIAVTVTGPNGVQVTYSTMVANY